MNTFRTWMAIATPDEQQALADAVCGGSRPHLYQIKNGHRKAGVSMATAIVRLTKGAVQGVDLVADHNKHLFNTKEQA